jgi:hypothetical protein
MISISHNMCPFSNYLWGLTSHSTSQPCTKVCESTFSYFSSYTNSLKGQLKVLSSHTLPYTIVLYRVPYTLVYTDIFCILTSPPTPRGRYALIQPLTCFYLWHTPENVLFTSFNGQSTLLDKFRCKIGLQ